MLQPTVPSCYRDSAMGDLPLSLWTLVQPTISLHRGLWTVRILQSL